MSIRETQILVSLICSVYFMHRCILKCLYMAISIKYCIPFIFGFEVITISVIYICKSICK